DINYNPNSWNFYNPTNLPSPAVAVGDINADGFDDILFDQGTPSNPSYIQLGSTEIAPSTPTTPPNTSLNSNTLVLGSSPNQIPIQGLPNRSQPYQTNAGGDVNGDGYMDIIITDTSNYDLTYVVYGQDWLTADEQNSGTETFTFFDGTNGNDVFTIPQNVTTPKIVLRGQNGDDFMLIPTANTSQIYAFGGEGDDQIGLGGEYGTDSKVIGKIDGGGGFDTIFIPQTIGQQTRLYLDANAGRLFNIEAIDIGYNNSVQFNQSSLLQMLDGNKKLLINGVHSTAYSSDNSSVNWNLLATDAYDGVVYNIYGIQNSAIEVWLEQGISFISLNGGESWGTHLNDTLDLSTSLGTNRINGLEGNDTIIGSEQRDIILGGGGHDVLRGKGGVDKLYGGAGDDLLDGGLGLDFLYGGQGSDHFVLRTGNGSDRIMDFNATEGDLLLLDNLGFGDLSFDGNKVYFGAEWLATVMDHTGIPVTEFATNPQWFTSI
ncbi:MAG: hypothetical protein RLZZ490_897, partial [Cyanobacteriota bacterium]